MRTNLGSYATAGVALVGASIITVVPVAAPVPDEARATSPAVQLSAAVDPLTPWLAVFDDSEVNLTNLVHSWLEAPAPVLQQVIANQLGYLQELPDLLAIVEQMGTNLEAAIRTPFAADSSTLEDSTRLMSHLGLFNILSDLMDVGAGPIPAELQPLIDFSTSSTTGVLLGLVGPVIGPSLALAAGLGAVYENLTGETPDLEAAFNALINTPAAMADAFLNGGQTLDLTPLLDAIGLDLSPAPGTNVDGVGITFGGLLSPGGSIFNALSFDINIGGLIDVPLAGTGPGAIGSLIALTKTIAEAIGWDGAGNPLAPPLETPATQSSTVDDPAQAPRALMNSQAVPLSIPTVKQAAGDETAKEATMSGESTRFEKGLADSTELKQEADESTSAARSLKGTDSPRSSITGTLKPVSERLDSPGSSTRNASAKTGVTKAQSSGKTADTGSTKRSVKNRSNAGTGDGE